MKVPRPDAACQIVKPFLAILSLTLLPLASMAASAGCGEVCKAYTDAGQLYANDDAELIQSFKLVGRMQYQLGYVDGEAGGDSFHSGWQDELRGLYVGAYVNALGFMRIGGQANVARDNGVDRDIEFQHMWDLTVSADLHKLSNWSRDSQLTVGYGAREVNMSEEWNVSSKKIHTVERSAISNKIWPYDGEFSNPTGAYAQFSKGALQSTAGVFSTSTHDYWAQWDDGELFYLKFLYDRSAASAADKSELLWTMFYQDAEAGEEALANGLQWASSLSSRYGSGNWMLRLEGIYGDNGEYGRGGQQKADDRQGDFWGVVVLPTVWLWQDRLEGVARYQYQAAEEAEGIRLNSRYVRRSETAEEDIAIPLGGAATSTTVATWA